MLQSYILNSARFLAAASAAGADVVIGNHTEYNDALGKLALLSARKTGEPNPYVVGAEA